MVTDTYAHGFDADRKVIAHEMDTGFFAKVENETKPQLPDDDFMEKLRAYIKQDPAFLQSILAEEKENGDRTTLLKTSQTLVNVSRC